MRKTATARLRDGSRLKSPAPRFTASTGALGLTADPALPMTRPVLSFLAVLATTLGAATGPIAPPAAGNARLSRSEHTMIRVLNAIRAAARPPAAAPEPRAQPRRRGAHERHAGARLLRPRLQRRHAARSPPAPLRERAHGGRDARGARRASRMLEQAVVRMWMDSPPHRAVMLSPGFRRIGHLAPLGHPRRFRDVGRDGRLRLAVLSPRPAMPPGSLLRSMAVVRRALSHPLVPTLAAAAIGAAYLIAAPDTADMAAHTYRTWLWSEGGFATWNAQWYGGHHIAGYSLLYPPLAALAGTRFVGVASAVAAVALFALPARRLAPTPAAAALASWLFLGGVMSNVVIGRMPFTLGVALAVGAWACVHRSRAAAAVLSLASVWASPVSGVFLAVAAIALVTAAPRAPGQPPGGARARRARRRGRRRDGGAVPRGRLGPLRRHGVLADAARLPRRAGARRPDPADGDLGGGDLRHGASRGVRDPEPAGAERAAPRRRARARAAGAVRAAAGAARWRSP